MDVRQLTYFLGVVDHGGFTRAAAALHVAQPSLSQSVRALERSLGAELFHRTGRGAELTSAGQQLIGPARQVLRDLDSAREAVRADRELLRGTVDLVAMPSPGVEPLTGLVSRFRSHHPGMSVSVAAAFTPQEVIQAVSTGSAELGLLGSAGRPHTADLSVRRLGSQPLVLISPPSTPDAAGAESIAREDLAGLDFVISPRGSLMRQLLDDVLAAGIPVNVVAEVAHRTSLLPMVQAGLGNTIMPEAWRDTARTSGCLIRRIEPAASLDIFLVARTSRLSPGAAALLSLAQEERDGDGLIQRTATHQ